MERNRKKQKERGITLVALIITIIVMLILVAVTVRIVVESDIIGTAEKTAEAKETGELKDQVAMKIGEWQLGKYVEETKDKTLIEYLNELKDDEAGITVAGSSKIGVITKGDTVITVNEAGEITTGQVDTWDGSRETPIIQDGNWYIYNAEQFKFLADYVNDDTTLTDEEKNAVTAIEEDTVVYLMANLDLGARPGEGATAAEKWATAANETVEWTPIGIDNNTKKFIGTFEGNGHVISGVYVSIDGNFGGIFGNAHTIQNLTVKDSYIEATGGATGGIVGAIREITDDSGNVISDTNLTNCHNINTQVHGGTYIVGGVVGQAKYVKVENCSNSGNVSSEGAMESSGEHLASFTGGVVGTGTDTTILNCYNSGEISGDGASIGGICGNLRTDSSASNCKNVGTVIGRGEFVGGIVGECGSNTVISGCINLSSISGTKSVGGISGLLFGTIEKSYNEGTVTGTTADIGGICGQIGGNAITIIENTYNKGTVIAEGSVTEFVGGIVGLVGNNATSVVIKNNYNRGIITITDASKTKNVGGAIGYINIVENVCEAENNYYLDTVVTEKGSNTSGTPIDDDEYMKSQAFVDDLNYGLEEKAWVKTNEYPTLIGI